MDKEAGRMSIQEWICLFYEKLDQWIKGDIDDKAFAVAVCRYLRTLEKMLPINLGKGE